MSDPKRMRDERTGTWEAHLIDAMRSDRPSQRSRHRALVGIAGAGASTAIGWTARAAVLRVLTHWPVWVGAGSVVALGVGHEMASRPAAPSTTAPRSRPSPGLQMPSPLAPPPTTPAGETSVPERDVASNPPLPAPRPIAPVLRAVQVAPPARTLPVTPPVSPTSSAAVGLKDEVASLYAIKRLLDANDSQNALLELGAHEQKFAHGTLKTEASILRVETLLQIGDTAHAAALGQMIIDESPNGPYARRIRSLLDHRHPEIDRESGGQ